MAASNDGGRKISPSRGRSSRSRASNASTRSPRAARRLSKAISGAVSMAVTDGGNRRPGQARSPAAVARAGGGRYAKGLWERRAVDAEERGTNAMSAARRRQRGRIGRWMRRILPALIVIALLPLGLTLVYRIPGVHPVSTLMLVDALTFAGYDRRWTTLDGLGRRQPHSGML